MINEAKWLDNSEIGIDIWHKKYSHGETFDEWLDRISGQDKELRRLILDKKFLFGGRILANRGLNKKVSYSNCYVVTPPEDNLESIFDCAKELARTYSYGGGCGVDISKLRPKGCLVNNAAETTSGAVSFMTLFDLTTSLIGQAGRRGALMISMDVHHPDILDFINIKQTDGAITKANISVRTSKEFWEAVDQDGMYELRWNGKTYNKIRAKEVFEKLVEGNYNWAEPGILYWDRIEDYHLMQYEEDFEFASVNPCVSGDTLILTERGYVPIIDVVGEELNIWNGQEWSLVTPRVTGKNQPMKKVHFKGYNDIKCTDYHKFIMKDGTRKEARELKTGDKLKKWDYPIIDCGEGIETKEAYTYGFFSGDGYKNEKENKAVIYLYGNKQELTPYLLYTHIREDKKEKRLALAVTEYYNKLNKFFVPNVDWSIQSRLEWLSGYLDADGTVNSTDGSLSCSSINLQFLKDIQFLLHTLGIKSVIGTMKEAGERLMPSHNENNDYKKYNCQKSYRLTISAFHSKQLKDLGLNTHRLNFNPQPKRETSRYIEVEAITDLPNEETVYCVNEPKNHSVIFNGIMTGNCAEEPLQAGSSCLLGSLNLSAFVKKPFTSSATFDMEQFKNAIKIAVRALNDVLDEGLPKHPLQIQRDTVHDWRAIGLGLFGLADTLIMLGKKYDTDEALEFCDTIGKFFADRSLRESARIAKEQGAFPKCNIRNILKSDFVLENASQKTIDLISEYGLANSQILTTAPTGTLSTMWGISGGLEPYFAFEYVRKTESLHGEDVYYKIDSKIVEDFKKATGGSELPSYFISSMEINSLMRVKMQGIWQKHIDASISSTVNLPEDVTMKEIYDIYRFGHEQGLKGLTIYRDGCMRSGILSTSGAPSETTELKRGEVIPAHNDVTGEKRTLQTGCGTLHSTAFFDKNTGELAETYLSKGSTGGCNNFMIAVSRLISLCARAGVSVEEIADQLKSCGTCPSYAVRAATHKDTSKGSSCPVAVGIALLEMADRKENKIIAKSVCPTCGAELVFEGGCNTCKNCGWSKCD